MLKSKKVISLLAIVCMLVTSSGLISSAKASSITQASDTLSTSGVSAVATHTITFTVNNALAVGDYIMATFPTGGGANFSNIDAAGALTCPAGATYTASRAATFAKCEITGGSVATSTSLTMTVSMVTNPNAIGSKIINLTTKTAGNVVIEKADIMVAIVDRVVMTATVLPTLTFAVAGVATGTTINGMPTTGSSTVNTLTFGNLTTGTSSILGQLLTVNTNANNGYTVTVEQNQDLTSNSNSTIDSFKDGTASTTAQGWTSPANVLGSFNTYGHMGVTTSDTVLAANQFTSNTWKGFIGTAVMPVMYHPTPVNGSVDGIGTTSVSYRIEVSPLQEAGDYTNTLTYICTPLF